MRSLSSSLGAFTIVPGASRKRQVPPTMSTADQPPTAKCRATEPVTPPLSFPNTLPITPQSPMVLPRTVINLEDDLRLNAPSIAGSSSNTTSAPKAAGKASAVSRNAAKDSHATRPLTVLTNPPTSNDISLAVFLLQLNMAQANLQELDLRYLTNRISMAQVWEAENEDKDAGENPFLNEDIATLPDTLGIRDLDLSSAHSLIQHLVNSASSSG